MVAGRREMLAETYQQDPPSLRPTNSASASPGRITLPATGPQPASQVGPTADPLAAHRIVKSQPLNLAEFNQLTHEERNAYIRNGHSLRDE